jgi:hypothetical protein
MIKTYLRVLDDGRHIIEKEETFNMNVLNLEPCLYVITIDKAKSKRSILQNSYYWAVVLGAFLEGYRDTNGEEISKEEAHETLKMELNYKTISNEETGEVVRIPKSTADINTKEFSEYVEKCRRFISEWFGVETPDPDPAYRVKIHKGYTP